MWIFSEAGGLFFFFLSARSLGIHKAKSTSAFFLSEAAANRNGFQEWNSLIATHLSLSISLCVGVLVHESAVVFFPLAARSISDGKRWRWNALGGRG